MLKKKARSPGKEFLLSFLFLFIFLAGAFLSFYYLGFNIGFPIALILLILLAYLSRRTIKQSDESFLTPTDRKFNMKIHPWLLGIPTFILFFISHYVREGSGLIEALILTLINFSFSFVLFLVLYYFRMKRLGYHRRLLVEMKTLYQTSMLLGLQRLEYEFETGKNPPFFPVSFYFHGVFKNRKHNSTNFDLILQKRGLVESITW
ncbi:hypothetical protein GLW07_17110 [Bacillus hwajinpoensis]|uniref:Uncharacterized protein n=1 Tax=Guptibacillus hwajinpoensis TaxID=208199 RepID=A0A845F2R2_9BACL|nr:hypothetical protein [Pseudalkalibacillus hwajinpoensis]MYL65080.1 hypothetical protein [Pseudalkalibacillus hwajinpoensis]